ESVFGVPVLVMEYVEHDSTPPDDFEFGRLARRIHALRGMKSGTAAMRGKGIAKVVTELTCARLNIATAISGRTLLPISPRRLENLLAPIGNSDNLLHMDLRFENVLCQHGKPCAVIDWANALIGDPLLEIARIHEYGLLSSNFSKGYGDCRLTEALNEPIGLACSLYTAAMMCILFLSEIPDEREAAKRLDRLEWLVGEIARRTGVGSS
ncbi:MAG: phosphotransferase family protein, partial [Burkholderiales bacterium]